MKKFSALILVTVVFLAVIGVQMVSASQIPEKTFSLDISDYDSSMGEGIKNGVTGETEGITAVRGLTAASSVKGPGVLTDIAANGETFDYLTFTDNNISENTAIPQKGIVKIDRNQTEQLFQDDEGVSFEYWIKSYWNANNGDKAQGGRYLTFFKDNNYEAGSPFDMFGYTHRPGYEGYTFRPFGTANMYGIQKEGADKTGTSAGLYYEEKQHSQSEKWTHMVITRDWNYDDGESGTGDYFVNIYIDGELVSSLSTQEYDAMLKPFDLNGCDMAIGGMLFKGGGENSAKSANICFAGGIAEFNIYSGVLDEAMVADAYNESSEKYSDAVELKSGLKLLSPLNSSVNPVPLPIKGSIDIVFDNVIDVDLLDNILFYKEGDEVDRNLYSITYSNATSKKITLNYSLLEETTRYILKIPSTITTPLGDALENPQTIVYLTGDRNIAKLDLSDDSVGTIPNDEAFTYLTGYVQDKSGFTVSEYNGVKSIKLPVVSAKDVHFGYVLPNNSTNDYVVEITFARDDDTADVIHASDIRYGRSIAVLNYKPGISGYNPDENGFITVKCTMIYDRENEKYKISVYDSDGKELSGKLYDKDTNYLGIFIQHRNKSDSTVATYISDYKVYPFVRPEISSHNAEGIMPDAEAIEFIFSQEIKPDSVKADSLTLVNVETERVIPAKVDAPEDNTKLIKLCPLEYLDPYTEYVVRFKGISNNDGNGVSEGYSIGFVSGARVFASEPVFEKAENQPINSLEGITGLSATSNITNNTGKLQTYIMFLNYTDASGVVTAVKTGTVQIENGKTKPLQANIDAISPKEGESVKCYIFGSDAEKFYPTHPIPFELNY